MSAAMPGETWPAHRTRSGSGSRSRSRNSRVADANFARATVQAQVQEMQLVREKVYTMEQTHMTLKQK